MKTKSLTLTSGLVTDPGVWTRNPESLSVASNCDLSKAGAIQKRRGFSNNTLNSYSGTVWQAMSSPILERDVGAGALLLATGPNASNGVTTLRVGIRNSTFSVIAGTWGSTVLQNAYYGRPRLATGTDGRDIVTINEDGGEMGPVVLDYGALTGRRLGIPRGMGLDRQNTTLSGGTGFLSAASAVRYAVVFVFGDPTNNGAQFGSPGMTTVVTNSTGASADVATRVLLPKQFGTTATNLPADTYWVQVYRSVVQATSLGEPPSELALVYQKMIEAADIAAGYVGFTDVVTDALRGANLYTNLLSGEDGFAGRGFINSNEPPPACSDLVTWSDCLWLAEPQDYSSQEAQLISVGGTGLVATDTITVDGTAYTAINPPGPPAANQFIVVSTGTASFNQRETALNICDAVNRSASNTSVYAYYVAGQAGLPGRIIFRGRQANSNISAATSRAGAFRIGTQDSNNPVFSGVTFSKPLQPYAHPVVNRFEIGRGDAKVLRIVPLRDSLYVFKQDGLFVITGSDYSTFQVTEFDPTFQLIGRECVTVLDDAVYAWGTQGIARITDGGVEYIDAPIKDQVISAMKLVAAANLSFNSFVVANARDGVVSFFYPTQDPDGAANGIVACSNALVWHARTRLWSKWTFARGSFDADQDIGYICGTSNVYDHSLSLGVWQLATSTGAWVHNERRTYASADFSDCNMSDVSNPTMSVTTISSVVSWRPLDAADLGAAQWLRVRFEQALATTTTQGPTTLTVTIAGDNPFGGGISITSQGTSPLSEIPAVSVAPVDQDAARSHALYVTVTADTVNNGFTLVGVSVDYRDVSRRGVAR